MFDARFLRGCAQSVKAQNHQLQHTGLWLCNYPFMEAIKPQTTAQLREWGCRITWSISDVSRTPFIGQMRLVTNYMSSWNVLWKLDLYSVATLSQIQTDDGRMEKEQISLFTGSSSWVQTPQRIWEKKNVWTYTTSWRKQQTDSEPQTPSLQLHTRTNTQVPKSVHYAFSPFMYSKEIKEWNSSCEMLLPSRQEKNIDNREAGDIAQ